jgi:hypothetical protein
MFDHLASARGPAAVEPQLDVAAMEADTEPAAANLEAVARVIGEDDAGG